MATSSPNETSSQIASSKELYQECANTTLYSNRNEHAASSSSSIENNQIIGWEKSETVELEISTQNVIIDKHESRIIDAYALHYAAAEGFLDRVHALIKSGANVNGKNEHGVTPLDLAVLFNRMNVAITLLDHGANPKSIDGLGRCSMHTAAVNSSLDMLKLLEKHEGNVNAKMIDQWSVMHSAALGITEAAENWNVIRWLLEKGAEPYSTDMYGTSVQDILNRKGSSYAEYYDELVRNIGSDSIPFDVKPRVYHAPMKLSGSSIYAKQQEFKRLYDSFFEKLEGDNRNGGEFMLSLVQPTDIMVSHGTETSYYLDTLARVILNRTDKNNGVDDICVALFIHHDGTLRIANNHSLGLGDYGLAQMNILKKWANKDPKERKVALITEDLREGAWGQAEQIIVDLLKLPEFLKSKLSNLRQSIETFASPRARLLPKPERRKQFEQIIDQCIEENKKHLQGSSKVPLDNIVRKILCSLRDAKYIAERIANDSTTDKIFQAIQKWQNSNVIQSPLKDVHAEMKILQFIYDNNRSKIKDDVTIGLSKLCCGACTLAIEKWKAKPEMTVHDVITSGTHAKFYRTWGAPGWLLDSQKHSEYIASLDINMVRQYRCVIEHTGFYNDINLLDKNLS